MVGTERGKLCWDAGGTSARTTTFLVPVFYGQQRVKRKAIQTSQKVAYVEKAQNTGADVKARAFMQRTPMDVRKELNCPSVKLRVTD